MAELDKAQPSQTSATVQAPGPLPAGYRQGLITAITVLLGYRHIWTRSAQRWVSIPENAARFEKQYIPHPG